MDNMDLMEIVACILVWGLLALNDFLGNIERLI